MQQRHNALHFACMNNPNIKVIKYLIESKGFDLVATNKDGNNALHLACAKNPNIEVIKYLVEKGINLNVTDKDGYNALHIACIENPNIEVIKYLIEKGIDYNQTNNENQTPLEILKSKNNQVIYEKVLDYIDAAEFADSLITTEITTESSNLQSLYLSDKLDDGINNLIINRVNSKIYNLTGVDHLKSLFKEYNKAKEVLSKNLEFLNVKGIYSFYDLTPNDNIPFLKLNCFRVIAITENKISITEKLLDLFPSLKNFKCCNELTKDLVFSEEEQESIVQHTGNNDNIYEDNI